MFTFVQTMYRSHNQMVTPILVNSVEKIYESNYHKEISLHLKTPGGICKPH